MAVVAGLLSAVTFVVVGTAAAPPAHADTPKDASTGSGGLFVALQQRLVDTRSNQGANGPLTAGSWTAVTAAGQAGIPAKGATALAVTLTAVSPSAEGTVSLATNLATPVQNTASFTALAYGADTTGPAPE